MKHHNLFFAIGIICIILIGSYFNHYTLTLQDSLEQQAADKAFSDSLLIEQAMIDSVYKSLPRNVLNDLYWQIGDDAPKRYIVDEYLEHKDYYNNLD